MGYYLMELSKDLPSEFKSEQGLSAYYEIVVAPSVTLSPNLHIVFDPGGTKDQDTAYAYGMRLQMYF